MNTYPRPVYAIHQIEITSNCNLRCRYCVHPHMKRKKMDMSFDIFLKALTMAKRCVIEYGQTELNLCGIGESTMHPEFERFFDMARRALPDTIIAIATNGILLDEEKAKILKRNRVATWVSLHRPEKAGRAVEIAKEYKILHGVSNDPSIAAIDWAGKVDWHVSASKDVVCPWLAAGRVMVCANGDITTCCLDGDGDGIIANIMDDDLCVEDLRIAPYSLCGDCHHIVPQEAAQDVELREAAR